MHTVTLTLPETLFRALERKARQSRQSIENEIVKNLEESFPVDDESLSPELEMIMEALTLMEDHTLWNVASARIADSVTDEMETLYHKRTNGGLSPDEERELSSMEKMFERNVLVRAQAAMLLKERGLLEKVPN